VAYELWDSSSGNRVGSFATRADALAAVREDAARYGRQSEVVQSLGLLHRGIRGTTLIADGSDLVERAFAEGMAGSPRLLRKVMNVAERVTQPAPSPRRVFRVAASGAKAGKQVKKDEQPGRSQPSSRKRRKE
jgi:hypothetical protein